MTESLLTPSDAPPLARAFQSAKARVESAADASKVLLPKAHVEYQRRPIDWMVEKLGEPRDRLHWSLSPEYATHQWDGTPDPLIVASQALADWKNCGVESATTTGKTYWLARIVAWWLACFERSLTVTVAPKAEQLNKHLWRELTELWPRFQKLFPRAERLAGSIRMVPGQDIWGAFAFVAGVAADEVDQSAKKAQGWHAEHLLIVFEETPGIAPAIMTAFRNTCQAPHNLRLAVGNPDHQLDELHRFCQGVNTVPVRISAYDHPNVVKDDPNFIPGAVSRQGIAARQIEEGEDSTLYKSRVRGMSPEQSTQALIRLEWVKAAIERAKTEGAALRTGVRAKGVDCAQSENGDKAAVSDWDGALCESVRAFPCPNSNRLGHDVFAEMWMQGEGWQVLPEYVGVDPVGVGAGTINVLHEKAGPLVQALFGGAAPVSRSAKAPDGGSYDWTPDENRFFNLRAQMWWQARDDLQHGRVGAPDDEQLARELVTPLFVVKGGKVRVEEKEEIKKRLGGRSPDKAEAFVYGNWVRRREKVPAAPPPREPPTVRDRTAVPWVEPQGEATEVRVDVNDVVGGLGSGF